MGHVYEIIRSPTQYALQDRLHQLPTLPYTHRQLQVHDAFAANFLGGYRMSTEKTNSIEYGHGLAKISLKLSLTSQMLYAVNAV